jgi:hypothetical protein
MALKLFMGGGAILVAVLLGLTQYMAWPGYLNYVWAVLVLLWGLIAFVKM